MPGWQRFRMDHKLIEIVNSGLQAQSMRLELHEAPDKRDTCGPLGRLPLENSGQSQLYKKETV